MHIQKINDVTRPATRLKKTRLDWNNPTRLSEEALMSVCEVTIHTWRRTQFHVWWRVSTLFVCTISYNLYYYEIFLLIHKKLYHTHMSQITKTHSDVVDRVNHGNWYNRHKLVTFSMSNSPWHGENLSWHGHASAWHSPEINGHAWYVCMYVCMYDIQTVVGTYIFQLYNLYDTGLLSIRTNAVTIAFEYVL